MFKFGMIRPANTGTWMSKQKVYAVNHIITNSTLMTVFKEARTTTDTSHHFSIAYAFKLKGTSRWDKLKKKMQA